MLLMRLQLNFYQIENEYGNIESSFGQKGKEYVKWAAEMALGLGAGVPWVMCKQVDAPGSVVRPLPCDVCPFVTNAYECYIALKNEK